MKNSAPINACRRAVLLFLIFFCTLLCRAQKGIDSALVFIEAHKKDDTLKVRALLQLSDLLQTANLQKALNYAIQANNIADKIGNDYYSALSKSRLASVQTWYGKTNEALALYLEEVTLAKSTGSNRLLQDAYDGIAYVYETENEWDLSLQYGLKSLSIAEKSSSAYDIAYSYHQLGSVYLGLGGYLKAELYLKKAKVIFINNANVERTAICNVDLAKVYMNLHYYNLAKT